MTSDKSSTTSPNQTHDELRERIVKVLRTIKDPEIPVNIYDLGLIYDLSITDDRRIHIRMTLTAPTCPVAEELVRQVQRQVAGVNGVAEAKVDLTWDPPWTPDKLSDAARLDLNLEPGEAPRRGGPSFYSINPPP